MKSIWWAFGLGCLGGWLSLAAEMPVRLPDGPWGWVEVSPLPLEPPEEALDQQALPDGREWAVPATDIAAVDRFWARSGLPAEARQTLRLRGRWDPAYPGFWVVNPPDELRLKLSPSTRRALYDLLGTTWRNSQHVLPLPLPPAEDPAWTEAALNPDLVTRLRTLAFDRRGQAVLVDGDLLLPLIRDRAERRRLIRLLTLTPALRLELGRASLAQREAVVRYWSLPGARPVEALLAWFDHSPELEAVDGWNLLPANARDLLNTFMPAQPDGRLLNCYWTSLNLTVESPDDRLLANGDLDDACADHAEAVLRRDYERVAAAARFGDVIALAQTAGDRMLLVHVMVRVAGDVVLTKNGCAPTQPLVFMREAQAMRRYLPPQPLQVSFWRRKVSASR